MQTDINDQMDIRTLVDAFYKRAGKDDLLGPIFLNVQNSGAHKETLYEYWTNSLFRQNAGEPERFPNHVELMFSTKHFIRWLTLFLDTIDLLYSGPVAEKAKVMVIKKSEEFQAKIELSRF
jgi:hemoglobin